MSAIAEARSGAGVSVVKALESENIGDEIYALAREIFPICRSITGPGVRDTLAQLRRHVPIEVHEVPTGTQAFDWTVPKEWSIRDAYIKNAQGERVVDFQKCNLHVLNYAAPVRAQLPLSELKKHIFTLPDQPDFIPYRTSYYNERWGFCMSQNALDALPEGDYEVLIDSSLEEGSLSYGEFVHRGETDDEFLFSAHICHPSLANDNCSGLSLLAHLAKRMGAARTHYTYRFLWTPGTIGGIVWLARNEALARRIKHGLVLSCVGDGGAYTYKRTRRGDAPIDRAMAHVLSQATGNPNLIDFFPYGYDERQYNSPGFKLDVGLFQRSQFATFPEYHTSGDNLDFIGPEHLADSYGAIAAAIDVIENDGRYRNTHPKGEPQLGKRGLYAAIGGDKESYAKSMAMLWILNLSDGDHSLLEIAERAKIRFRLVVETAELLETNGLLVRV